MRTSMSVLSCLVLLSACGGGSGGSGTTVGMTPTPAPTPAPTATPTPTAASYTASFLYSFGTVPEAGGQPNGPLIQANDGSFYGTTRAGGGTRCTVGCGVLFRLTPGGMASGVHSFGVAAGDGERPTAPLIQGSDGALYGMTSFGGAYGSGTVFKVTLSGAYSILYSFGATPSDGLVPTGGLIQGIDGNFYGTTSSGGANHCSQIPALGGNCGTVFRITPAGVETILYSFGSYAADGVEPESSLVQGRDGNFYGTTVNGGANSCSNDAAPNNCGTIFKVTPAGVATVLHSFGEGSTAGMLTHDGIAPQGALIIGPDGALYGTTVSGGFGRCGGSFGCGTVFRITEAGALSILYEFAVNNAADGYGPSPFLTLGKDGNFYGTTGSGGALGGDLLGTVFRMTPAGAKTILYSFGPNSDPSNPVGGLVQGTDNAFYGVTAYGRNGASGTIFKLSSQ